MTIVLLTAASGTEAFAVVDVDGTEHSLERGLGYYVQAGMAGRWALDLSFGEQPVPLQPGTHIRAVVVGPRTVDIPILVEGSTELQRHARMRDLAGWVNGRRGESRFIVTGPDGESREITGRGSLKGGESRAERYKVWQRCVISLHCPEPYWADVDEQTDTYTTGGTAATWFGRKWFPYRLASSTVLDTVSIDNSGDAEAWPSWTITGPGSNPVLRNLTSGAVLSLTQTLTAGQQIVIDTRPGVKSITDGLGSNLFGSQSSDSELWPFVQGVQRIQIELASATSDSSVELSYKRRYLTP